MEVGLASPMAGPKEEETALVMIGLETILLRPILGVLGSDEITVGEEATGLGTPI